MNKQDVRPPNKEEVARLQLQREVVSQIRFRSQRKVWKGHTSTIERNATFSALEVMAVRTSSFGSVPFALIERSFAMKRGNRLRPSLEPGSALE